MEIIKKIIAVTMSLCILFMSVMSFLPIANAAVQGTITGNEVRFRSAPSTAGEKLAVLNSGDIISVTNTNKVSGAGCSDGWYSADYNGKSGYVCSTYVLLEGETSSASYERPWTSPKKAIIGGAAFIAGGYLGVGQNTIYLKKFNVNPASIYEPHNHEYQANIAAPFNEAKTSYNSYRDNGLLSLPLHFTIPIYNNMPEYTTHPVTGKEEGGTSEVKDQAFEEELNKQGFDETYKKWLRALHEKYPNWTFESIKTNLDFNASVAAEKKVGAVSKSCSACLDANNIYPEVGWGTPNDQTMAYFLDPRNFLMEDSILMFEDLSNNSYYTEAMVKNVLKGTFMEGNDNVDGIPYSTLFMEAAKSYNVSPVYLASLSRQEVGTKMGLVTSGEQFEYKGITYVGFYNFYNIGARSSEENPAKAGLVYAAAGAVPNSDGVYVGNIGSDDPSIPVTDPDTGGGSSTLPVVTPVASHLSNMGLNRKGSYLTNVTIGATVATLKSKTNGEELTFKDINGNVIGNTEKVTTGTTITFSTGETYTVLIYGDLNGNGDVDLVDLQMLKMYLLGKQQLSDASLNAAKVVDKNEQKPTITDLQKIKFTILGRENIVQA